MSELALALAHTDELRSKLEEGKMKIIDLEIELNESSLILSEVLKISDSQELTKIKKSKSFFELQKSGKVVDRLDKCRFSRSFNDLNALHAEKTTEKPSMPKLARKISSLSKEIAVKNSKIIEQQRCISILEEALRENNNIAEFEQLLAVVRSKDERITKLENIINKKSGSISTDFKDKRILELEDALKESFTIAAEREKVFYEEEQRRIATLHKMRKMEQRIRSLQNASVMNCGTCSSVLRRLKQLEESLKECERRRNAAVYSLARVIQDILKGAISEKDSQIAELELKGVLNESETAKCDALKSERDRLLQRLKIENEHIVEVQRCTYQAPRLEESALPDLTLADELIAVDNEEDIPATVL